MLQDSISIIMMKKLILIFILLCLRPILATQTNHKYYSAIKEVIEEVRPKPSMREVGQFLQSAPIIPKTQTLERNAKQIADFIFKTSKISGDESYFSRSNEDNILPDSVIKMKQGHCLGLTILFLLVAEKNNLIAQFVRGPDHVFPRLCDSAKCINVEMLKKGEIKDDQYYINNLIIPKLALDKKIYLSGLDSPKELQASIYLGLGFVANKAGQKDLAELFYFKSTQSSAKFAEPHSNLAAIYADTGRIEDALKELNAAIEINPSHYASLINLGVIEQARGKIEKALELYNKALESNPIAVDAYRKRSTIYVSKKDWKNAGLDLDRILVIQPRFCDVIEERIRISEYGTKLPNSNLSLQLKRLKLENMCLLLPVK